MTKARRGRYTLEFKQEAVRLVESGQRMAAVSRSLRVVEQTLYNRAKGKHVLRLVNRLQNLGFDVQITPRAA